MIQELLDRVDVEGLVNGFIAALPNLLAALVVLVLGWGLLRLTRPVLRRALRRADFSPGLRDLLTDNVYGIVVMTAAFVMAADQIGINVTAALAGMGVAGLAVGFAAQDSLANTIAGFLIFWDKPFRVGDFVSVEGNYGEVVEITLRTTRIRTRNNTHVVIPNKEIIDDVLTNHSLYGETRIDVPIGVAYAADVDQTRAVLLDAADGLDGVLDDPAPAVVMVGLGSSSVDLELRIWTCEAESERPIYFAALERCKAALDEAGIEIPFPHMQLHVDRVREPVWAQLAESVQVPAEN